MSEIFFNIYIYKQRNSIDYYRQCLMKFPMAEAVITIYATLSDFSLHEALYL